MHCRYCNKCIRNLDHHCFYIHNCIAPPNYKVFITCLVSLFVMSFGMVIGFLIVLTDSTCLVPKLFGTLTNLLKLIDYLYRNSIPTSTPIIMVHTLIPPNTPLINRIIFHIVPFIITRCIELVQDDYNRVLES